MRRAPIVVSATVLGTAGVLLFKPLGTAATGASATAPAAGTSASTAAVPSPSASSSPASSSAGSSASASAAGARSGTYTGTAETTRFGTTQVRVTIAGGRITAVSAVQLNQDDPRSYQISTSAEPTLRSEVLSAQTAAVDTVSGATWTTAAYEASLQSALDQAGFAAADGSKASTDLSTLQESGGGFGGH